MRWKLRRVVNSLVLSTYPLTGKDRKDVTTYVSFVRKKCRYIYPQVINGHSTGKTLTNEKTLKKSQPYKHSAITRALKTFFAGDKAPGVVYHDFFVSTLPNNDEKEIPMSMLAFVASVVHFSLGEWVSGSRVPQKANDLRSEYEKNIAVLNQIACDPRKYHRLMADLYRIASGNDHDGNTSDDGVPDIDLADLDG
ncbi:hypothetical protein K435DRAFT_781725 [Dendrothele bispora CBS 962.96]|uniref:DUF6532 domain-containing protein n=1 Tax=Dendrothele bispora (strain CBS 962.96) TaxID=1314807 RepID=A0A4S8LJF6_DENBC|nr:hypothetical protein K435DRAFT_781725 [Dendrothele bispora CBS 962.96]